MADTLPPEQRATYAAMIDGILKDADLEQISAKAIRNAMQQRISYDITPQKNAITAIIMERFDRAQAQAQDPAPAPVAPLPTVNGHYEQNGTSHKRKAETQAEYDSDLSSVVDAPASNKVKKRKSNQEVESDEAFAAKLQAQFNAQDRPTRGGGVTKKRAVVKKEKKSKKKSAARVGSGDDSDINGASSEEVKERKGAFHKPYSLSEPLAAMIGETQLSRPQTVKKIWAYVKENQLQDPADKRQFICDPTMRAVFKADKVHMFTMNKLLGAHLYPLDEA